MALTTPRLPRRFFARDPVVLARDLLGRVLFYRTAEGLLAGRIVEGLKQAFGAEVRS